MKKFFMLFLSATTLISASAQAASSFPVNSTAHSQSLSAAKNICYDNIYVDCSVGAQANGYKNFKLTGVSYKVVPPKTTTVPWEVSCTATCTIYGK